MRAAGGLMTEPAAKPKRHRSVKYSAAPLVTDAHLDDRSLGSCMRALSPRLRRFVLELHAGPCGYGSEIRAARAAGFGTPTSSNSSMKALAYQALHNPKVQDALREVGAKIIRAAAFGSIKNV